MDEEEFVLFDYTINNESNYELDYNQLLDRKRNARYVFEKDVNKGLETYLLILTDIEKTENKHNKSKGSNEYTNLLLLKKYVNSNIALCYFKLGLYLDSVWYDEKIISQIDKQYDKSYARLIQSYLNAKDFDRADKCKEFMQNTFNETICSQYIDIFENATQEINQEKQRNKHKLKKPNSGYFRYFVAFLILSSSVGLFFLYKFNKKFKK